MVYRLISVATTRLFWTPASIRTRSPLWIVSEWPWTLVFEVSRTGTSMADVPSVTIRSTVVPAAGVTLPLAAGATVDLIVTLGTSAIDVPVRLTSKTKVHGQSLTIHNGDRVRIEAGVQNNLVVATEIKR